LGILVDWIQEAPAGGVVLNPGAYGHTSIALHDAIRAAGVPVIEVHLSNIYQREPFRHHSTISPVAAGVICGLGPLGYVLALEALAAILPRQAGEGEHAKHGGGGLALEPAGTAKR
jgi:3-dehydroquinate dehydratase-2